ncbi:hypothetical protein N0V83_010063 [Neocucurbitaria cava]|uniref:Aldehyde dehydrogenase domain-containing protein n=1 Tax=Neocucurbitaria cava TaxID=798079 RepID=A0A9W8Y190_9PLEO|nr:hypothetical protein N0V83_010063 [Neocucurbitaria cava]
MSSTIIPLLINGIDITTTNASLSESACLFQPNLDNDTNRNIYAQLLRDRSEETQALIKEEISCSGLWAEINVADSIAIAEEVAATVTSGVLSGVAPVVRDPEAQAIVFKEPYGVVLGIAPWNAPLILGLRAIAAAVAAGNTVVFKGSEICPRTHHLIAKLFRDAGFPQGVVNFIQHSPADAASCFEAIVSHKAVRKCNFTGSTAVGRHIAQRAAFYLKPVTLELGGKNFAIVLEDADMEKAVDPVIFGAFLNSGQICMSTDVVLVARSVEQQFRNLVRTKLSQGAQQVTEVINAKSQLRITELVKNAMENGAEKTTVKSGSRDLPVMIENITPTMDFWTQEAFGPLLGLRAFDSEGEAVKIVNDCQYGLSGAIFSRNHMRALKLAKMLNTGAVHINSGTVHDEPCLPHGGRKESGWGRFGAYWAFEEFLQTKTVILHP